MQVDVYAFAMIAFELFEGRIPFGREKPIVAAQSAAMDRQRPVFGATNRYSEPCILSALIDSMRTSIFRCETPACTGASEHHLHHHVCM